MKMQKFTSVGIKWKFIVQFSSWKGDFYERFVEVVKSLRKAIQRTFLATTKLQTYTTECEHIYNSRSLDDIDDNIKLTEAITPNHFMLKS